MSDGKFKIAQNPQAAKPSPAGNDFESLREAAEPRVLKLDEGATPVVQQFRFGSIESSKDYAQVKSRYGALAGSDADRRARTRKDERFTLNPISRERLSIDEEERRAIEERVQARVAEIKEQAYREGREQGYADGSRQGHEEAFARFKQEADERVARLEELVRSFDGLKAEIFKANEKFLIDLVYRIGRMILLRELSADREYVLRLARHLIERVGVRENIRIRLNPAELETAAMLREGLEKAVGQLPNLQIEPSAHVERGGCILETDWNAIDASIETQLAAAHEALQGGSR